MLKEFLTTNEPSPLTGPVAVIMFIIITLYFMRRIDKEAEEAQRLNGDIS